MKNKLFFISLLSGMILLSGCKEETKSYDWYTKNKESAYSVHEKCLKTGEDSQNCENARRAFNAHESARKLGYSLN